jgi:hypothetical protein
VTSTELKVPNVLDSLRSLLENVPKNDVAAKFKCMTEKFEQLLTDREGKNR